MRSTKSSDSPCGYCRDTYRTRGRVTVTTIQQDFAQALTQVNDLRVRYGAPVPALEPVDDVLRQIEGLARAGRLEGLQVTLDKIGALAIAARLSHSRAEVVDVAAGDEAA